MLLAEIHGHAIPEARDNEDLLTSTVFGHLRYIPPQFFWKEFLGRAWSLPTDLGEQTFTTFLASRGCRVEAYSQVRTLFWPEHSELGCPDLILCFTGATQLPLVLVIECKLWAEKSGVGEADQLGRYLNLAQDLRGISPSLLPNEIRDAHFAVLYLTPRESRVEVEETALLREAHGDRHLLFRAQWQDIIECSGNAEMDGMLDAMSQMILGEIVVFLQRRGLEYFRGFRRCSLDVIPVRCGFYSGGGAFGRREDLTYFPVQRAGWMAA